MEAQYAAISICVADEIIVVVITLLNWLQCAGIICIKTAAENPVQRISRAPVQQNQNIKPSVIQLPRTIVRSSYHWPFEKKETLYFYFAFCDRFNYSSLMLSFFLSLSRSRWLTSGGLSVCKYLSDSMKMRRPGAVLNVSGFIGDTPEARALLVWKGGVFPFEFLKS